MAPQGRGGYKGRGRGGHHGGRGGRGDNADQNGDTKMRTERGGRSGTGRHVRTDRDGDVSMGAASTKPKGNGLNKKVDSGGVGKHNNKRDSRPGKVAPKNIARIQAHLDSEDTSSPTSHGGPSKKKGGLDEIQVFGIEKSKAAGNPDKGRQALVDFLERKAGKRVIKKSRLEGDVLVICVDPDDTPSFLKTDGLTFTGNVQLRVVMTNPAKGYSEDAQKMVDKIKLMLDTRYSAPQKLLNLSDLENDPVFAGTGVMDARRGKTFFTSVMVVSEQAFRGGAVEKRNAIESVSLAQNKLDSVAPVDSLAVTYPDIKNIDLSRNNISQLSDLEGFRRRFRRLEQIYLADNPLVQKNPGYAEQLKTWFPSLQVVDGIVVRTALEAASEYRKQSGQITFEIRAPVFSDDTGIGEQFIRTFYHLFDSNRPSLVSTYYDAKSVFSVSVVPSEIDRLDKSFGKRNPWERFSRNFLKVNSASTRQDRRYLGADKINTIFLELPLTKHPDLDKETPKWAIEGHGIPGVPDPTGQSAVGVNGLLLTIHGEFSELEADGQTVYKARSFDRTFILGPAVGQTPIRVISDKLTIREHQSHDAWLPQKAVGMEQEDAETAIQTQIPAEHGELTAGKTEDQVRKEYLERQLMLATRMKLHLARQCLENTQYIPEKALQAFHEQKALIPLDGYF